MTRLIFFILFALLTTNAFALNPKKEYDITPDQYGMDYQEVSITTKDQVKLYGWHFSPADPKSIKCVIISHDGEGNMEDMIEIAGNFISMGYHVLTYDYRGYGKSDDFTISKQFYIYAQFEKDMQAAIEFVRKEINGIRQIDLYGRGIGAGLSIAVGAGQRTHVRHIIADSPYYTMNDIREKYQKEKGQDIKVPVGFNKNTFEPAHAMDNPGASRKRFLFIAGKDDDIYDKKIVKNLNDMTDNGDIYLVRKATAQTTYSSDRKQYFEKLKTFLNEE
ncbi:MAG: alpha/beta hydrolase [Bacteroidales bacterium]